MEGLDAPILLYRTLNTFFLLFHTLFVLFNMTGWVWRRTRPFHLAAVLMTAFSWFVLGIWYGYGFCFCTEWHWRVREGLGFLDRSHSYIHFLILEITGRDLPVHLVDGVVVGVFATTSVLSVALSARDLWLRRRANPHPPPVP